MEYVSSQSGDDICNIYNTFGKWIMFCNLMIRFAVFPTEKRFICSPISYQYLGNLDHIYKLVDKSVLNISFLDLNLIFWALTQILYFGLSEAFDVLGSVKHLIFWAL